jgi:cell division protein FtsL
MNKSIFSFALIGLAIYFLFQMNSKVQNTKEEILNLKKQIEQDKNDIHLLKAEWSYLTNPERIKTLSKKHLSSKLQIASQFKKNNKYLVFNDKKNK